MKRYTYQTRGVCAKQISFELEDKLLHNVVFHGGCPGNTSAISRLLEGRDAAEAASQETIATAAEPPAPISWQSP